MGPLSRKANRRKSRSFNFNLNFETVHPNTNPRPENSMRFLLSWLSTATALNIVVTNDDGFETENIQALFEALTAKGHDVVMSAPYGAQSGTGGALGFLTPIVETTKASPKGTFDAGAPGVGPTGLGPQQFYVDGSPAASMLYGVDVIAMDLWGAFPDLVISGPNEGNNLGVIIPHSGTVGAAVTALNKGIPAIAYSGASGDPAAAPVLGALAVRLVDALGDLPPGTGLNVNVPPIELEKETNATKVAEDFVFLLTTIGSSSNIGIQFLQRLNDSVLFPVPTGGEFPGVAVAIPPASAGYPNDPDPLSETNALTPNVVTVSPIQGTYAACPTNFDQAATALSSILQSPMDGARDLSFSYSYSHL